MLLLLQSGRDRDEQAITVVVVAVCRTKDEDRDEDVAGLAETKGLTQQVIEVGRFCHFGGL